MVLCPPCLGRGTRRKQDSRWSILVCFCATLSQALIMGVAQGFGVFLPVIMDEFNASRERTAWIGSAALALTFFFGPVASKLCDRFGCRPVVIVGALICSSSLLLTSFVKNVDLFFVTYSLIFGIGSSFCRPGNFLITAKYFVKGKSLTTGLVSAGASIGMFILGPLNQKLIDNLGLSSTYRVLGCAELATCVLSLTYDPSIDEPSEEDKGVLDREAKPEATDEETTDPDIAKKPRPKVLDFSVWKVPTFAVVAWCGFLNAIANIIPQFHLIRYCEELGITADKASRLFIMFGLTSCVTRICVGKLCDVKWINSRYVLQVGMFILGLSIMMFAVPSTYTPIAIISVFYGLGGGITVTISNLLLLTSVEPARRAAAFGQANALISVAMATSGPLGGFIADETGSYVVAFYMAGAIGLLSACLPFILLCVKPSTVRKEENQGTEGIQGMVNETVDEE